jgi:transcriptional regulator with XRE-family HTH domain
LASTAGSGRDELSGTLRALREGAGIAQARAGAQAGIGQRKISRFEAGTYIPTPDELNALLRVYRAPAEIAGRLRQIVRDIRSAIRPVRAVLQRGELAAVQDRIRRIEAASGHVRSFHPSMVIGLLQTGAYVRGVFGDGQGHPEDAEAAGSIRVDGRQAGLADPNRRLTLVQTEGALRWTFGSAALMVDQLDHIAELAVRWPDRVRIGIIPAARPAPLYAAHGFHLYDDTHALVATRTGTTILADPRDVTDYRALFDRYAELAEYGEAAVDLASRIAADHRAHALVAQGRG